jgi:threonyl-tRNA synthetase
MVYLYFHFIGPLFLHLYLLHDTLQEYKEFLEEAKKRDHRMVGLAQELFFFHPLRYLIIPL